MANRRQFLQAAAGASAAPIAAKAAWAERTAGTAQGPDIVVVDSRFAAARAFGERMAASGATVRAIEGDVTVLWRDELRMRWAQGEATTVAGMTAPPALFCLERLSWEHGLRVTLHAEHRFAADGGIEHAVRRAALGLGEADLRESGPRWIDVVARTLAAHRGDAARPVGPTDAGLRDEVGERPDDSLTSWIIAPRASA